MQNVFVFLWNQKNKLYSYQKTGIVIYFIHFLVQSWTDGPFFKALGDKWY